MGRGAYYKNQKMSPSSYLDLIIRRLSSKLTVKTWRFNDKRNKGKCFNGFLIT